MASIFESTGQIGRASFTKTNTGDVTAIAAKGDCIIKVLAMVLTVSAAAQVLIEEGTGGTALSGDFYLAANGSIVLPYNPAGYFVTTTKNTLLNVQLTGTAVLQGWVLYQYQESHS